LAPPFLSSSFCVILAGEFNSGKSTLINALVGQNILQTGNLPTTDTITVLGAFTAPDSTEEWPDEGPDIPSTAAQTQHQQTNFDYAGRSDMIFIEKNDTPLLRDLTIIDTPGTNADDAHTQQTLNLLPHADLILFVTSADRPLCQSERQLLESLREFRKQIVIVINKMDVLDHAGGHYGHKEKQRIIQYVHEQAQDLLLGTACTVIPISSRDAMAAKSLQHQQQSQNTRLAPSVAIGADDAQRQSPTAAVWKRSNFSALEAYLHETLTTETKIKSKLLSPIGVVQKQLHHCIQKLSQERDSLDADVSTLKLLQSQLLGWKKELQSDMERSSRALQEQLVLEGERASVFVRRFGVIDFYRASGLLGSSQRDLFAAWDRTLPVTRSSAAGNDKVSYNNQSSLRSDLSDMVHETADGIAVRGRAQGQSVIEFLGKRPGTHGQTSLITSVTAASRFEETRQSLVDGMSVAINRSIGVKPELDIQGRRDDADREADKLLGKLQTSSRLATALSLGAVSSAAWVTSLGDVSYLGVGASVAMMMTSGAIAHFYPSQLAQRYRDLWSSKAQDLDESLALIFEKELERIERKVQDGVSPYSRFVQAEQERIEILTDDCHDASRAAQGIRQRINRLFG